MLYILMGYGFIFFVTDNLNPFASLFGERDRLEKEGDGGFNSCRFLNRLYHIFEQNSEVNEWICTDNVT